MKSRFLAQASFMDDIEEEKLPERVKLSIASAGIGKLDTAEQEMDLTKEKERGLDILQQLLPEADLASRHKPIKEFKAVTRYDPTSQASAQFEVKNLSKQQTSISGKKKDSSKPELAAGKKLSGESNLKIMKGIDKKKAQIEKANQILKKSIDIFEKATVKPHGKLGPNGQNQNSAGSKVPAVKVKRHVVKEVKSQKWKDISAQKSELKEFKLFG